jgi:hypothetical protein
MNIHILGCAAESGANGVLVNVVTVVEVVCLIPDAMIRIPALPDLQVDSSGLANRV